jgi:hypothetical protein
MAVTWDKGVALALIQAGYIRMVRKHHPDAGGSHEEMLVLTATKEHLEKLLAGGGHSYTGDSYTYQRAREAPPRRPRSTYRNTRSQYWDQADQSKKTEGYNPEIPLQPYEADSAYVQLIDVTIMSVTEKAFKIKISGVQMPQWLPKSQLLYTDFELDKVAEGDVVTLVFTKWIARQKGWIM